MHHHTTEQRQQNLENRNLIVHNLCCALGFGTGLGLGSGLVLGLGIYTLMLVVAHRTDDHAGSFHDWLTN